ncbi:MAG: DNA polymerase III subunit gamma/tau, partial [Chloroflexales bacterium]|nr:DNA polymerase III subunit gamma/tau [Chloroflexales bacterium]
PQPATPPASVQAPAPQPATPQPGSPQQTSSSTTTNLGPEPQPVAHPTQSSNAAEWDIEVDSSNTVGTQHSALSPQHSVDELLPPVPDAPEAAPAAQAPPPEDAAVQAANADIASLEQIEAVWPQVVRDVRVFDKTLQALLNSGVRPTDVEDNTVVLEVGSEFIYSKLEKPNFRQIIERVLSKHTGGSYGIRCVVETQQNRENPNDLRTQIRRARQDEWVRAAINVFDADVVAVEQPDPAL